MNKMRSLSVNLSFGIMLMAVPVFIVALGILFIQSRHFIRGEAVERAVNVLNTTMQRINSYMNTIETATNVNVWQASECLQPDSLQAITNRIVRLNRHVDGCSITTEPGTFPQYGRYFSTYTYRQDDSIYTVLRPDYEYFDRIWYKTPRDKGTPCWVDPFNEFNKGTPYSTKKIATYCNPIFQADGRFLGVISTDLSLRELAETIESATLPYQHSYFMMIGDNGLYLIHPDTTRLFQETIFNGVNPRRQADIIALGHEMTAGKTGSMAANIEGEACLVCYQPVPGTGWSVALVCPDRDILQAYHWLTFIIIVLIVIGLTVIMLLCQRTVAHAIRPLHELVDQTQLIAAGQYDRQIAQSDKLDAVAQLQNSFAAMQQSLASHVNDIRQANAETTRRNEELAKATRQAEEAVKQKTLFIQNMTHQIRTPLNIVLGFAQVLRDEFRQMPKTESTALVNMMKHNSTHLLRMVLMLFDSSDIGISEELNSHKHEPVSCNDVCRESIMFTNLHFPDLPIQFSTEVDDDFSIPTNHLYLMRSIREILYNAGKYSDGQHIALYVRLTETTVRIIIEDKGPGIAANESDALFKPFIKSNDLSEGLGLGLPLSRRHIQNLGGDLRLDTDYHEGCRFIIELPRTPITT